MIDALVTLALRKRLVMAMICVFLAIYGYYSWTQLAIDAYPDIADTSSRVITQAPGMAAEEVEQRITVPLALREGDAAPPSIGRTEPRSPPRRERAPPAYGP